MEDLDNGVFRELTMIEDIVSILKKKERLQDLVNLDLNIKTNYNTFVENLLKDIILYDFLMTTYFFSRILGRDFNKILSVFDLGDIPEGFKLDKNIERILVSSILDLNSENEFIFDETFKLFLNIFKRHLSAYFLPKNEDENHINSVSRSNIAEDLSAIVERFEEILYIFGRRVKHSNYGYYTFRRKGLDVMTFLGALYYVTFLHPYDKKEKIILYSEDFLKSDEETKKKFLKAFLGAIGISVFRLITLRSSIYKFAKKEILKNLFMYPVSKRCPLRISTLENHILKKERSLNPEMIKIRYHVRAMAVYELTKKNILRIFPKIKEIVQKGDFDPITYVYDVFHQDEADLLLNSLVILYHAMLLSKEGLRDDRLGELFKRRIEEILKRKKDIIKGKYDISNDFDPKRIPHHFDFRQANPRAEILIIYKRMGETIGLFMHLISSHGWYI